MGRQSNATLRITDYAPDRLLTLATPVGARPSIRQSYQLEPASGSCQLTFHLDLDGVPKMAERLVKTQISHQVKGIFESLGTVVAER